MHAFRVLEYGAICERLAAHAETELGYANAVDARPEFAREGVDRLLAQTAEALDAFGRETVPSLRHARDMRSAVKRASKGGVLGGMELLHIWELAACLRQWRDVFGNRESDYPRLFAIIDSFPSLPYLERALRDSIDTDGSVRSDASPELAQLRRQKSVFLGRIQERIQAYISGRHRELLSDPIYTMRDGRYVIPLKAENRGKIRGIVHDSSASGQTIFIEPEDVLQLGNQLREVEGAERAEEHRILTILSRQVGDEADLLRTGIELAGDLDLIFARARFTIAEHAKLPELLSGDTPAIRIERGIHPLLDREKAIPLDIEVGRERNVLITGPNTGGKTVAIKCVGLFVLMAQTGLGLPALRVAINPFGQVWADIGDEQSLEQSLSTFSGHIKNIADALRWMKPGALVLLDEVGAGTDPAEGAALAVSVLREMADNGATIMASTHYGELKAFAFNDPRFENAAMEFDTKNLQPTYRLIVGSAGASQALRIAERYGIPKPIVERAREELGTQAQDIANMLEQLQRAQDLARRAQSDADKRAAELKLAEARAARKLTEADDIRRSAHDKANEVIESALREIRLEANALFDEVRLRPGDQAVRDRARARLRDLDSVGREFAREFLPRTTPAPLNPEIGKGAHVRMAGYTQAGVVMDEPKNGRATVQIGPIKMTVNLANLTLAEAPRPAARRNLTLQKATTASPEIHLRHKRADTALEELDRFLDDAVLAGFGSVRIVHGKGEGVLRKVTQDFLRRHAHIAAYRDGDETEGGQGVTIATLR